MNIRKGLDTILGLAVIAGGLTLGGYALSGLANANAQTSKSEEFENGTIINIYEYYAEQERNKADSRLRLENLPVSRRQIPQRNLGPAPFSADVTPGLVRTSAKREYKPKTKNVKQKTNTQYSQTDYLNIAKILYAEAAICESETRREIVRVILDRTHSPGYAHSIAEVINQESAFTAVKDNSRNWRQVNGQEAMNNYDRQIFAQCLNDARVACESYSPSKTKIVAYHDDSKPIPQEGYWKSLKPYKKLENITFFTSK